MTTLIFPPQTGKAKRTTLQSGIVREQSYWVITYQIIQKEYDTGAHSDHLNSVYIMLPVNWYYILQLNLQSTLVCCTKKGIILRKNQLPKRDRTQVGLLSLHAQGMNTKSEQSLNSLDPNKFQLPVRKTETVVRSQGS